MEQSAMDDGFEGEESDAGEDRDLEDRVFESNMFDAAWYRENYCPDVLSDEEAFQHFLKFGIHEHNDPGPQFNTKFYISRYSDVKDNGIVPFIHFIYFGKHEGRLPNQKEEWRNGLLLTKTALNPLIERYGYEIGEHSYGHPRVIGDYFARLSIGKFCSIGPDVDLILANHRKSFVSTYPFNWFSSRWPTAEGLEPDHVSAGDIRIGNDVWIGSKAVILTGVTIGDGAIVGAASVVRRDVPPYAIVAGSPATVIGYRFEPRIRESLQRIAWWDWPDERIAEMLPLMLQGHIETFIAACADRS